MLTKISQNQAFFHNWLFRLFLSLFLGLILFFNSPSVTKAVQIGTSVTVAEITFTLDSANVNLGAITPGLPVTATNTLTVSTGNDSGFTIKVKRNDSDTTLDLNDDASINIPDRTAWNPTANSGNGNASVWQINDRHLGFRVQKTDTDNGNYSAAWWGSDDTNTNAKFAGLPSSLTTIVNRSTEAPSGVDSVVLYKLDTPNTQLTGIYSGEITYSATVNL